MSKTEFGWVADQLGLSFCLSLIFSCRYEFRIPAVSIVDHEKLFNRGFSFNFVELVWAVFGGILR